MRTRRPDVASIDELFATRYGQPAPRLLQGASDLAALLEGAYGPPATPPQAAVGAAASRVLSTVCDDARSTLAQRRVPSRFAAAPVPPWPAQGRRGEPDERTGGASAESPLAEPPARTEGAPATTAGPAPSPWDGSSGPSGPSGMANGRDPSTAPSTGSDAMRSADTNGTAVPPERSQSMSEDDLLAEIEAIVSGKSVYDPLRQKTVAKAAPTAPSTAPAAVAPATATATSLPPGDGQAIFDRIAQSMQYAGAYDLGTVELENRFTAFDRSAEPPLAARRAATGVPASPSARIDPVAIADDFAAILRTPAANVPPAAVRGPAAWATAASTPVGFSTPFYASGEHVLAGDALYRDQLLVGRPPGVLFSYGQLIAMADLFGSIDDMMAADAGSLAKLKSLLERSTAAARHDAGAVDPGNREWQDATAGRYLRLAEDNYDHFAPNLLFPNPAFQSAAARFGDHKQAWQRHHERAIREAQRLALDPASRVSSTLPVWPLVVNAFGDHFLTDAFSAGHVINKAAVGEYFRSVFYSGNALTAAGSAFFDRVAAKAWHGDVAAKFKKLETAAPHDAWWNVVRWHPDIKNAERFGAVLRAAAEAEPVKLANLAVKAVHDALNRDGVEVSNDAGAAPWHLTGDGHLTAATLAVMRQAVAESAGQITDPSIFASQLDLGPYFARVWRFVPTLTAAAQTGVQALVARFIDPASAPFADAAAAIVHDECDLLIKVLIEQKALQPIQR